MLKQFQKDKISLFNLKLKFKSLKKELAVMRRDKENLEKKQKSIHRDISGIKDNHEEILAEMRDFTQRKNDPLLEDARVVSETLAKKNKELELILKVRLTRTRTWTRATSRKSRRSSATGSS